MTALAIFHLSVVVCFLLSTAFHTFSDHSPEMHKFGNELDHLGIVLVFWGSGAPSDYFGFYCDQSLRNTYFVAITTTAFACAVFTMRPAFRRPEYRTMRFLMYCFLGASLFVPAAHGVYRVGWAEQNRRMSLNYFIGLGVLNFSGAALYAARIPERWFPEVFDVVGQSHNIMHVLVVCGAMSHLTGLLKALDYWTMQADALGGICKS